MAMRRSAGRAASQGLALTVLVLIAGATFILHHRAPLTPQQLELEAEKIHSLEAEARATCTALENRQMSLPVARGHLRMIRELATGISSDLGRRRTPHDLAGERSQVLDETQALIRRLPPAG